MTVHTSRLHRLNLTLLRNRVWIIGGVILFFYVFTFVLGFILLNRLQTVVNTVEDNQKGTLCIISIKPQDRNKVNITDCVNKNRRPGSGTVNFTDTNGDTVGDSKDSKPSIILQETPAKIDPIDQEPEPEPEPTKPVKQTVKKVEERINALGQLECRLLNGIDRGWFLC